MSNTTKKKYVNNKQLYENMVEYITSLDNWKESGEKGTKPQIPDYVAESIVKIAENLGNRPNFSGYTFLDDMKGDGIENCIRYIGNYDLKSKNPFAYFTQIIWYAFIRRIQKEKKHSYIKWKSLESTELPFALQNGDEGDHYRNTFAEFYANEMADKIRDFEETQENKRQKRRKKIEEDNLESILSDD